MIRGLSIGDYRSIGEAQFIGPLGKINLFVGPNNAGKSNVLRFLNENLQFLAASIREGRQKALDSKPHAKRQKPSHGGLGVSAPLSALERILKPSGKPAQRLVDRIHKELVTNDLLWINNQYPDAELVRKAGTWAEGHAWRELWQTTSSQSGGGLTEHWIPETLRLLKELIPRQIAVYAIPVERQADHQPSVEAKGNGVRVLGGKGVIRALAAMQNPQHASFEDDRKRFREIEEFVRVVTDDAAANISVTHKQDEILVQMRGQPFLPLSSLGSGIEQVVLHAVAATSAADAVVTFEEPELHLHPVLQRQLMRFLARTSNQYFISTHSAHLIDAMHSNTFHVKLAGGETVIEEASTDAQRHKICCDLGYRPSDIVQANCVVWVEGPSDRLYIRHWLKLTDEHLAEHVHFSIMFYGGKLLSHVSAGEIDAGEDDLEDLIQLRSLNRQIAVIIDSDRKSADEEIRKTKARIEEEIGHHGGFVWISAGREIENYVPTDTLAAAVEVVAPGRGVLVKRGQYEKTLPLAGPNSTSPVDKVATATSVVQAGCGLEMLDLRERVQQLSSFIRKANGLPLLT